MNLKTIGYGFIAVGLAGIAISTVSKLVKLNQEKKLKADENLKPLNEAEEVVVSGSVAIGGRPSPAKIRHHQQLLEQTEAFAAQLNRSAKKNLSTVRRRTKVVVSKKPTSN